MTLMRVWRDQSLMSSDLKEGIESSEGDPKVAAVLNVVLSALFAYIVLWLSDFVGILEFTLERFVVFALIIIILTFFVVWD